MQCLRCKRRIASYRGNCAACLTAVRRLIKAEETTDAAEVEAGRRLPCGRKAAREKWGRRIFGR